MNTVDALCRHCGQPIRWLSGSQMVCRACYDALLRQHEVLESLAIPHTPHSPVNVEAIGDLERAVSRLLGSNLSETEQRILARRFLGHSDSQIAPQLFMAEATVRTHTATILRKCHLDSVRQIPAFLLCRAMDWPGLATS